MLRFIGKQWITILLLIFVLIYTLGALQYGIQVRPNPQSGFVPFLLGVMMIGMTGFILARGFLEKGNLEKGEEKEAIPRGKFLLFLVLLLSSAACFEVVGFFLTSTMMIFLTAFMMGLRSWWKALILAGVATLIADILFAGLLGVPLPGILSTRFLGGS
jgi:hypothetical protein